MIRNATEAMEQLADGLWWMKGFRAGTDSDREGDAHTVMCQLRDARDWLSSLARGATRVLEPGRIGAQVYTERKDGGLVVLTFAEIEHIFDGLKATAAPEDRQAGLTVIESVVKQFSAQSSQIMTDDGPF